MDYSTATRYLISLGNEVRASASNSVHAAKLGLENITVLLDDLDRPQDSFPSVLVAGTNGKGSVAAMLEAVLRAAGLRSGLYTSPHLVEITERIQLAGQPIPPEEFAALFTVLLARIEKLLAAGRLRFHPTYFECLTTMAMEYFRQQECGLAVLEVGMGGRLDATNVAAPHVAVITPIDFDHERFLGHSITAIASEKAGIIKPGSVVVSAASHPEAVEVIRAKADQQGARLIETWQEYSAEEVWSKGGQYCFRARDRQGLAFPVELSLRGRHQIANALAVVAAARELSLQGFPISAQAIQEGLATAQWPGRLELVQEKPPVYLDGAHNPAGARSLVRFWEENFPGWRILLVYGAMRDKAVAEIAEILFPRAAAVVLTQPRQFRAAAPETIRDLASHLNPGISIEHSPEAALVTAIAMAGPQDVIFVTGSLYLVGDIKRRWSPGPPTQNQSPKPLAVASSHY
ncbi:MAG: bifunctional folylpolyglutamate synthase/dihydrofolate synthase [Acidobacteria bacterium]|nr:bifunctional folylpolyglutamate synthase/dihydrofolate synthase [Acidobacteriota bacterium]